MLIIKASVVGSALMLLASCTGYLTNYQNSLRSGARLRMCTVHDGEPELARLPRLRKSQIKGLLGLALWPEQPEKFPEGAGICTKR